MIGLLSYGAYHPALRLQRDAVARFNGWFTGPSRGKRERTGQLGRDSGTMAIEAPRNCLVGIGQTPSSICKHLLDRNHQPLRINIRQNIFQSGSTFPQGRSPARRSGI